MKDNSNYMMLLNNAETLIESSGFNSLSIRNLAKQSGVSTGYLYNYFKNKDALIDALMDYFYQKHLHNKICTLNHNLSFIEYLDQLSSILSDATYDEMIHEQVLRHYKSHFINGLKRVYLNDQNVKNNQDSSLDTDILIEFIADHLLYLPKQNYQVLRTLLTNTLYKEKI